MKHLLLFLFTLTVLLSSSAQEEEGPVSIKEFTYQPFNFKPTIKNFKKMDSPSLKMQKSIFKNHPTDTIYKFHRGKNEIFINRSPQDEIFIAAVIKSRRIELKGGIKTGMSLEELRNTFNKLLSKEKDNIIQIKGDQYPYTITFIFNRWNRLKLIRIKNDQ